MTTYGAVTRSAVTASVSRRPLSSTTAWVPASIATSTIGVASAAVRQRFAARLAARQQARGAEAAQRERERRRREAEQRAAEQADADRQQQALEDRERDGPHALEDQRHRDAAAEAERTDEQLQDAGPGALDRRLAQRLGGPRAAGAAGRGEDRELGDEDAAAERGDERNPRAARREAGGTVP